MNELLKLIGELKIIPVVAIESADDANRLADALEQGGLPCAEITLRTNAAIDAIAALANRPDFLVGAGTVHNAEQAQRATDAGAKFVVAPGFNPNTVAWCVGNNVPVFPGVSSPTDLEMALEHKLDVVKFFPAEALGGVKMLKALSAPYGDLKFVPTGGINIGNLNQYLALPSVLACGGSWMVKKQLLDEGQFDEVTRLTSEAVETLGRMTAENEVRGVKRAR